MKKYLSILAILCAGCFASCTRIDNPEDTGVYTGLPLVIIDTDIVASTDDLFALEMLYRYEDQGLCKLLGVVVNREGEDNAVFADVMNTYFGHGDVPIGLARESVKDSEVFTDYRKVADVKDAGGQPLFQRSVGDYAALPDGYQLYRRLLASQPDHSVSIVSVGFVSCLAGLLQSGADGYSELNGIDLVRKKVKCIYIQGGVFDEPGKSDYNFGQGMPFSLTFFNLWPEDVPMMFSPGKVGRTVRYAPEDVIADISWTDCHPIKQVYLMDGFEDTGQKMWDVMPVIQAIEGDGGFVLSETGYVSIDENAFTTFTSSATGNCRYQKPVDEAWSQAKLEIIRSVNRIH